MIGLFGLVVLVSAVFGAFRWGGTDERLAGMGFLIASMATWLLDRSFASTQIPVLIIDTLLLAALTIIALRSDRFWPMWAAGFQTVAVTVHVASMTESGDHAWAYAVGLIFWSYPVLLALMAGTWLEARYRRN